ncbi:hypothetical protein [Modestobacter sp. I12A-02662]|uniref:hypothetical protein n=1 Tax=Modestobacter sp. I12A-02662 TaxID=1730496 RepID=UPI0034E027D7
MAKLSFLAGLGAGYVLGARAGRERYEQIRRMYHHAKEDPRLQSAAGMAQARADAAVGTVKSKLTGHQPTTGGSRSTTGGSQSTVGGQQPPVGGQGPTVR